MRMRKEELLEALQGAERRASLYWLLAADLVEGRRPDASAWYEEGGEAVELRLYRSDACHGGYVAVLYNGRLSQVLYLDDLAKSGRRNYDFAFSEALGKLLLARSRVLAEKRG